MQIVIDISEEKLSIIKNKMYCGIYDPDLYKAVANGTPLDEIRAEIKEQIDNLDAYMVHMGAGQPDKVCVEYKEVKKLLNTLEEGT